jgi:selenocysteine lyase/cysteine desulfurase
VGAVTADSLAPRSDFPVLADRAVTYLNTASIGLVSAPVQAAVTAFADQIAGTGTMRFTDEDEARVYEGAREAGARLLGCDPVDIAVTTSATEAINQVAWWLTPERGTNVVVVDMDFPSAVFAWKRVAEETGCEVRYVRALHDPASLSFDRVAGAVDDATAVISVSHVQFATGHVFDAAALSELAHAHGATLVLDATQSAGMIPIDVRAAGVDVLVAGAYKWLCSAFGAALCYLSPAVAERFRPPFVGWRSTPDQVSFDAVEMPLARGARGMEFSTVAYPSGVALGAAIGYLLDLGIDRVAEHGARLADRLLEGMEALGGELVTPRDPAQRGSIVASRFGGGDHDRARALAAALADVGVYTSPRLGAIRFAPHVYNDDADVDRALEQVQHVIGRDGG